MHRSSTIMRGIDLIATMAVRSNAWMKAVRVARRQLYLMTSTVPASTTTSRSTPSTSDRVLTMETLNPNIIAMEYAVLGPIAARASEIEKELQQVCKLFMLADRTATQHDRLLAS